MKDTRAWFPAAIALVLCGGMCSAQQVTKCYDDLNPPPGGSNYSCPGIDDQIAGDPDPVSSVFHGKSDPAMRSDPGFNGAGNRTIWLGYSVPEIHDNRVPVIGIHIAKSTDAGRTFAAYDSPHISHGVLYPYILENGVNDRSAGAGGGHDRSSTPFSVRNEIFGFSFGQDQTPPNHEVFAVHVNYWVPVGSRAQMADSHYMVLAQSFTGIDGLSSAYLATRKLNRGKGRVARAVYLVGADVAKEPAGCSGRDCQVAATCAANCNVLLADPAYNAPWAYRNWSGANQGELHQTAAPVVLHLDRMPFLYPGPVNGFTPGRLAACSRFTEPTIYDDVDNLYNFSGGGAKGHAYLYLVTRCMTSPLVQANSPILVFRADPVDIADPDNWKFAGPLGGNAELKAFFKYDGINSGALALDAPEVAIGVKGDPLLIAIGQFAARDDGGKGRPYPGVGWPCIAFKAPLDKRVSHPHDAGPGMFFDSSGNVTYGGGSLDVLAEIKTPELMPDAAGAPAGGPPFGYEAPQTPKSEDLAWDDAPRGTNAACAYDRNATGGSVKDHIGVSGIVQAYQYFHSNGGTRASMHNTGLRP
jgi:hypothetical protein